MPCPDVTSLNPADRVALAVGDACSLPAQDRHNPNALAVRNTLVRLVGMSEMLHDIP